MTVVTTLAAGRDGWRSHRADPGKPKSLLGPGVCVLGSGSGGNCTVLRCVDGGLMLIDAGLGPRTTARRLAQAGCSLDQVRALCVTHFDRDHFRSPWVKVLAEKRIPLWCHGWHTEDFLSIRGAEHLFDAGLVQCFEEGESLKPCTSLHFRGLRVQHDRQGCIAYRIELSGERGITTVGYATDLGHAPPALIDHFAGVDVLCIESNYDEHMTIHSPRPSFVNRRNLSDSGHLSNEQAFEAVQRIADRSPHGNPRRVLLLHRSQQCNHPTKVRRCFQRDASLSRRVTLTEQRRRTRWFTVPPMPCVRRYQMRLMW